MVNRRHGNLRYRVWHHCGFSTKWTEPAMAWAFGIMIGAGAISILVAFLNATPFIPVKIHELAGPAMNVTLTLSIASALFAITITLLDMLSNHYYEWSQEHTSKLTSAYNKAHPTARTDPYSSLIHTWMLIPLSLQEKVTLIYAGVSPYDALTHAYTHEDLTIMTALTNPELTRPTGNRAEM